MAFRDPLLAARARLHSVEGELRKAHEKASRSDDLERENRALRAALARARADYMPTAARHLAVGGTGAAVMAVYLLTKLALSLAGAGLHQPNIALIAFGAMLVGLYALCQLSFGTTAPAGLLLALFVFNQLAVLTSGVEMAAIANVSWLSTIALGTYIVLRAHLLPRWLARLSAATLAATGLAQLAVALSWDHLRGVALAGDCRADTLMTMLGNGLLALYLGAAATLAGCFFVARQQLIQAAPLPSDAASSLGGEKEM